MVVVSASVQDNGPQVLRVFLRFLAALCLVRGWGGVGWEEGGVGAVISIPLYLCACSQASAHAAQ